MSHTSVTADVELLFSSVTGWVGVRLGRSQALPSKASRLMAHNQRKAYFTSSLQLGCEACLARAICQAVQLVIVAVPLKTTFTGFVMCSQNQLATVMC